MTAATVFCTAIIALAGASGDKSPTGFLGLTWGDDAATHARRLGLTFDRWDPWIDPAFETSMDLDHPLPILGVDGLVRLFRSGGMQLGAVQVIYPACAGNDAQKRHLRERLRRELHLKSPGVDVPYEIWSDHSLVHFMADPRDGTCTLTVAGPRFGPAFGAALLRGGLGKLGTAIAPR